MKKILFNAVITSIASAYFAALPVFAGVSLGKGNSSNFSGTKNTTPLGFRGNGQSFSGTAGFNDGIRGQASSLRQRLSIARDAASRGAAPAPQPPLETIVVQPDPEYVAPATVKPTKQVKPRIRGRG
jgi:hypothetical protein